MNTSRRWQRLLLTYSTDTMEVAASPAAFTLPTAIANGSGSGSAISVGVQAEPTGLTCTVAGGTGTGTVIVGDTGNNKVRKIAQD